MKQADFQQFHAVMQGMAKVYERELDSILLDAYWLALLDWSLTEFNLAAAQLLRTSKFMPRPADFAALRKAALPTAGEAWSAVLQHLRGGYRTGGLIPEIDRAVRALGGYRALAMMPASELPWQEKRFAEHYGDMFEADDRRKALLLHGSLHPLLTAP